MKDRIMVKVTASGEVLDLRTVSRSQKSPGSFSILRERLAQMEREPEQWLIVHSMDSFAVMTLRTETGGQKILEMDITWLQSQGGNRLAGWKERIRLPYAPFHAYVEGNGETERIAWKQLSIPERIDRRLVFHSRERLREVVRYPALRRKLGKLLVRGFQWSGTEEIVIYDDCAPFSFYFQEYRSYGPGICGGIILHQAETLKAAQYSIHT